MGQGIEKLTRDDARRAAIAAQGLRDGLPRGTVTRRQLHRLFARVGVVQLDSVNVVARSHELVLHTRLGHYDMELLSRAAYSHRDYFEYWGHEASLIPVAHHPLFRWRMARGETWGGMATVARDRPDYVEAVFAEVASRGPITARELTDPGKRRGAWWGGGEGKRALEWLFWTGRVAAGGRRNFERIYDLPEHVIPAPILALPTPTEEQAHRELLIIAARASGPATAPDLADYYRLPRPAARLRIAELCAQGRLVACAVEGWRETAYVVPDVAVPIRDVARPALLSPFDSLIWFRPRTERLFGMRFRLEIFVPGAQRTHGYYVLPLLYRGRLVARVDLKSDRKAGRLIVLAAHAEPGVRADEIAGVLIDELRRMAEWLSLDAVIVKRRGDLAVSLRRAAM